MKPLEDMDLLDDFLNNCAASSSYNTEIYRIILETLLEKPLGNISITSQKPISSVNPNLRGIRLDVSINEMDDLNTNVTTIYDYEPHHGLSADLFKAVRFRQASMDSHLVTTGTKDFRVLPNLYIIFILDEDPFGGDFLSYSVEKIVREMPDFIYEDGYHLFFFNTKGHRGGSQSIRNMLSYIGNSHIDNVKDEATKKLDEYVTNLKSSDIVRGEYMTWEQIIEQEMKERDAIISEKDSVIAEKNSQLAKKDSQLAEKETLIAEKDAEIMALKKQLAEQATL